MHAHGSFTAAACIACGKKRDLEEVKREVLRKRVPTCGECGGESINLGESTQFDTCARSGWFWMELPPTLVLANFWNMTYGRICF